MDSTTDPATTALDVTTTEDDAVENTTLSGSTIGSGDPSCDNNEQNIGKISASTNGAKTYTYMYSVHVRTSRKLMQHCTSYKQSVFCWLFKGAIIGGVIGILVVLGLLVAGLILLYFYIRRR